MLIIHFDFIDGTEVSYAEGKELGDNFTTNCLNFFTTYGAPNSDVVVVKKDGSYISRNDLLNGKHPTYDKQIRKAHNIDKMLIAGCFEFKQEKANNE